MRQLLLPSKIKLKALVWLFVSLFAASGMQAQEISVSSFRALENDLTANTYGTLQKDHNGEIAALIKIPTTIQGFTFDGGMVGIVKVEQHVGEIWVYVPHGIKRISLFHQQLGHLRDYYFPISIEKARTYEMKLLVGDAQIIEDLVVNQQLVQFQVNPANASIEINGVPLFVNEQGLASKRLDDGSYSYKISCANYYTQAGNLEVKASGNAAPSEERLQINLKANFGWIDIQAPEAYHGAYIYLNDERIGQVPMKTSLLKSGDYQLRIMKPGYKNFEAQVQVSDNETLSLMLQMEENFARIRLLAQEGTEIWIDGEKKALGMTELQLEPGEYQVETRKNRHEPAITLLKVENQTAQTITLNEPQPMKGSLSVQSEPQQVKVYMDDVFLGETPLTQNDINIGEHRLLMEKPGYFPLRQTIEIAHKDTFSLNATLRKKLNNNDYLRNASLYAGAGLSLQSFVCGTLGVYFAKGINVEANYRYSETKEYIKQHADIRLGYGLKLGKHFLLTPQAGLLARKEKTYTWDYVDGYVLHDDLYVPECLLAARFQYCLNPYMSLSLSAQAAVASKAAGKWVSQADANVHLIFVIPFTK